MSQENFQIAENIIASYEARIRVVKETVEDTHKMLGEFRRKREKMAEELRESLAKFQSLRKKDFDRMMGDILALQKEREESVKIMLSNFQTQEMKVVQDLRKMLARGENLRIQDFKKTLAKIKKDQEIRQKSSRDIGGEITRMQSEVHEMLENFKKEREKVPSEWQNMVASMAKKRQVP